MPAVARLGDKDTGHDGFPPRACDSASSDVFAGGIAIHCQGDHWPTHRSGKSSHDAVTVGGSSTVFVNGKPIARVGDAISCGGTIAEGSPTVFAG